MNDPLIPTPVPVNLPNLPEGLPKMNDDAPKYLMTDEQIKFMLDAAGALIPSLKQYWPLIVSIMVLIGGLGAGIGRVTSPAPVNPAPVNPAPVNPAPVNPAPAVNIPTPNILPPEKLRWHYRFYLTPDIELPDSIKKNKDVSIDPKTYEPGSAYSIPGRNVQLPCFVIINQGMIVDVVSFRSIDDSALTQVFDTTKK